MIFDGKIWAGAKFVTQTPSQNFAKAKFKRALGQICMLITVTQLVLAALLIVAILLQQRGSGLSGAFGGDSSSGYSTRRGAEKILFRGTIVIAILFFAVSVVRLLL